MLSLDAETDRDLQELENILSNAMEELEATRKTGVEAERMIIGATVQAAHPEPAAVLEAEPAGKRRCKRRS